MKMNMAQEMGRYYVQWVTERVVTSEGHHDVRIMGWCVRERNKIGFIAETDTEAKAEALVKLLNSQADIEERT